MSPTVLPRLMSLTYGSTTLGGANTARVLNKIYISEGDFEKAFVEFTVTIIQPSAAAFAAEVTALETAFRTPRLNLTVTQGGGTLVNWNHANSYGYNAFPKILKYGDSNDGGFSRWYKVRIEAGLPADVTNTNYRRNSTVNVDYSPSRRRTVTITATYTANGGTTARAQYQASFQAYYTSVLNTLGGVYKILRSPQETADDQNKEVNISVSFDEQIYPSSPGYGTASLRDEKLSISRVTSTPGDSPLPSVVERLIHLSAKYEAWFDNTVTIDLVGQWTLLQSGVMSEIQKVLTGGSLAVIDETPDFDRSNNKITVTLTCVGSTRNGVLEYLETVTTDQFLGNILVGTTDGNPWSKYLYQGPGKYQRKIRQEFTTMNVYPSLFTPNATDPPDGFLSVQLDSHVSKSPIQWGIPAYPQTIQATKVVVEWTLEFYQEPQGNVATPDTSGDNSVATPSGGAATPAGGSSSTPVSTPGAGGSPPDGGGQPGVAPSPVATPDPGVITIPGAGTVQGGIWYAPGYGPGGSGQGSSPPLGS
jgi:hypothetical protein